MNLSEIKKQVGDLKYDYSAGDQYIVRSAERALKENEANCISGALVACKLLEEEGYQPQLLDILGPNYGHCVAIYETNNTWNSIGHSRHESLKNKEGFSSINEMVNAYAHAAEQKGHATTKYRLVDMNILGKYINWRDDSENLDKKGINQLLTLFPAETYTK